jgi:hypothetical protein
MTPVRRTSPRRSWSDRRVYLRRPNGLELLRELVNSAGPVTSRGFEIKGKVPDLYVSLKPGQQPSEEIRKRVENSVIREIGPLPARAVW